MNHYEAINHARNAADNLGYAWSDTVLADRYRIWPWEPFWRVIPQVEKETSDSTIVIVYEHTARTRVFRVRPWSDYDLVRVVVFPLLLLAALGCVATVVMRVLGFFSSRLGGSGPSGILFFVVGGLTLFSVPILRFLGKDLWFLRRKLREEKHAEMMRHNGEGKTSENSDVRSGSL